MPMARIAAVAAVGALRYSRDAMTFGSQGPGARRVWDDPRIVMPDADTWSRLSAQEREAVVERIEAVLDEHREAMSEGVRHSKRKAGIAADLDAHFRRVGRGVLLANELAVLYPGEPVIVPDVLAVLDCDPDYEPERWIVQDEKRGPDIVIEVRNLGRKHKDVVENVRDYARVRIPEYFSFDCRRGLLRGWRLAHAGAQTYQPVLPQGGYLRSNVLGLDLAVVQMRLRFFANQSMIPNDRELVARLQALSDEQLGALDEAERQRSESERLRSESERLRTEAERQRDDALDQLSRVQVVLARTILDACRLRGVTLTDDQSARVATESDVGALTRWSERIFSAATADEILAE
jgi:Uma2 family endonuclease